MDKVRMRMTQAGVWNAAAAIELEPDAGCLTYTRVDETESADADEWEEDEFEEEFEEEEEDLYDEEDDDDVWDEDEDDDY